MSKITSILLISYYPHPITFILKVQQLKLLIKAYFKKESMILEWTRIALVTRNTSPLALSHWERIKPRRKTGTFTRNPEFLSLTEIAPFRARVRNGRQGIEKQIETWKTTKRKRERERERRIGKIRFRDRTREEKSHRETFHFFFSPLVPFEGGRGGSHPFCRMGWDPG